MAYTITDVEDRFTPKVCMHDIRGCWPWVGAKSPAGYGHFWMNERTLAAHVASWLLFVGPLPLGMYVLHRCDNPPCVRPDHLFAGTPLENVRDMMRKGRAKFSSRKLTEQQVSDLRRMRSAGDSLATLAARFHISEALVSTTARGLAYTSAQRQPGATSSPP